MRARLANPDETILLFDCPGCEQAHMVYVKPRERFHGGRPAPVWGWNGSLDLPTLSPSVLVRWQHGEQREERRCHSFVRDGRIQFLADCTHALAGQTVNLPEIDP